jgi:hypothetical protein
VCAALLVVFLVLIVVPYQAADGEYLGKYYNQQLFVLTKVANLNTVLINTINTTNRRLSNARGDIFQPDTGIPFDFFKSLKVIYM